MRDRSELTLLFLFLLLSTHSQITRTLAHKKKMVYMLGNPKAIEVFVSELLNLHRGQGQDILWRDNVRCPSESEYEQMVVDKTGGLFRLAVGLMRVFATTNDSKTYAKLVNDLALYFQIRDDLVNLASEEYMKSKR